MTYPVPSETDLALDDAVRFDAAELSLRILAGLPEWPGVLAALETVDEEDLWHASAELAFRGLPGLVSRGLEAMSWLCVRGSWQ